MVDLSIVEDEIAALEAEPETTYDLCERLACLYTVRDHIKEKNGTGLTSEFMEAALSVPVSGLLAVIDEHMQAIKVVYPGEYDAVMAKIRKIGQ